MIISGGVDLSPGAVIALTTVVTGYCFVEAGWPLWASVSMGLLVGILAGLVSAWLIVRVGLPPFIATLGVMGIWRGTAFIVTQARFFDLSAKLPSNWHVAGVSIDWMGPVVMIVLAGLFQVLSTRYQWGRGVFAVGGNETAALFSGIPVNRIKTSAYVLSGLLAAVSGVVLAIVQGQGKADLATGYELDIIASAVVGGASLAGGRGSVAGAVLGALIFGVLRNALRADSGRDVLRSSDRRRRRDRDCGDGPGVVEKNPVMYGLHILDSGSFTSMRNTLVFATDHRRCGVRRRGTDHHDAGTAEPAVRAYSEGARHSRVRLRERRGAAEGEGARQRRGHLPRARACR